MCSTGQYGSVGVSAYKLKGHWFISWSGYIPRLWFGSSRCFSLTSVFLSLSLSLSSPFSKINKHVLK